MAEYELERISFIRLTELVKNPELEEFIRDVISDDFTHGDTSLSLVHAQEFYEIFLNKGLRTSTDSKILNPRLFPAWDEFLITLSVLDGVYISL